MKIHSFGSRRSSRAKPRSDRTSEASRCLVRSVVVIYTSIQVYGLRAVLTRVEALCASLEPFNWASFS